MQSGRMILGMRNSSYSFRDFSDTKSEMWYLKKKEYMYQFKQREREREKREREKRERECVLCPYSP